MTTGETRSDEPTAPPPFNPLADLGLALAFLTRLPMPVDHDRAADGFGRAVWAWPLAGALIGALAGGTLYLSSRLGLYPMAAALLGLGVAALITGALHEDGLADFLDGLGGNTRERRLEIMRDSRVGTFGVLALVFSVGLRAVVLASLAGPGFAAATMVAGAALSRAAMVPAMRWLPPARGDGLGAGAGRPPRAAMAAALILGVGGVVALLAPALGPGVLWVVAGGLAAPAVVGWLAQRRLGGHTGDVFGAQQQVSEIAVYVAAACAEVMP